MESKKRERRYKCDECSSAFTTKYQIKGHKSSVHSELRPFQCEHCDYSAKLKGTLTQHYAMHFPSIYKTHSCPQCPYASTRRWKLLTHFRVHTKEKPFGCKLCPYRASVRSSLTAHIRSHTGEKPFKCSLCTSTFSQWTSLNNHKLLVHSQKDVCLVACSFPGCSKLLTTRQGLQQHVNRCHLQRLRPFKCLFCEHRTVTSAALNLHLKTHTGEKPYCCDLCKRCFTCSRKLSTHIATDHSELRPFRCDLCPYSSRTKNILHRHKMIHEEMPTTFECNICKESQVSSSKKRRKFFYRSKSHLGDHMRKVHLISSVLAARLRNNLRCDIFQQKGLPKASPLMERHLRLISQLIRESVTRCGMNKGVTNHETEQTGEYQPCFVRLVRMKELKWGPLGKATMRIYA